MVSKLCEGVKDAFYLMNQIGCFILGGHDYNQADICVHCDYTKELTK